MAGALTSDKLIRSIKRRAMIPENQNTFTDDDFLEFANEEIQMGMVPMILKHREDFFLVQEATDLVSNQSEYEIPYRAIGNRLRDVSFRDSNGNIYEMTRIEVQDEPNYNGPYQGDLVHAFYVLNNKIVIKPSLPIDVRGELLFTYYMRRNDMVAESRAATITSIDRATGMIGVNSIPVDDNNLSIFSTATRLDFIGHKSPHIILNFDMTPAAVNTTSNTITFTTTDIPSDLQVGDYVNLACEAIVPQIPSDLHMQLAQRVAIRCLDAMGDVQGVQTATAMLGELNQNASSIIDNRVEGAPRKIVNRHGLLRDGLFRRRFRFRS